MLLAALIAFAVLAVAVTLVVLGLCTSAARGDRVLEQQLADARSGERRATPR